MIMIPSQYDKLIIRFFFLLLIWSFENLIRYEYLWRLITVYRVQTYSDKVKHRFLMDNNLSSWIYSLAVVDRRSCWHHKYDTLIQICGMLIKIYYFVAVVDAWDCFMTNYRDDVLDNTLIFHDNWREIITSYILIMKILIISITRLFNSMIIYFKSIRLEHT